jgi:hypothetical protein
MTRLLFCQLLLGTLALAACAAPVAERREREASLRVAGFVEAAGIT